MRDPAIIAKQVVQLIDGHSDGGIEPRRGGPDHRAHVKWMMLQIPVIVAQGQREKAMRWLSFAQGFLWSQGYVSLGELRAINQGKLPFNIDPESNAITILEVDDEEPTQDGQISAAR